MRSVARLSSIVAIALAACAPEQGYTPDDARSSATSAAAAEPSPVDSNLALSDNGGGCFAPLLKDLLDPTGGLTVLLGLVNPEWAPVINGTAPISEPVLIHGTATESHVSHEDFPSGHVTFDQNTLLELDGPDSGFLATGNADRRLELEWETGSYPAWAWAGVGDRVVALGRWIFDCGHPDPLKPGLCHGTTDAACLSSVDCGGAECEGAILGYRSEMHPPQAVAVIRSGRGGILEGDDDDEGEAVPVTRADVFVSANGGGAGDACVVTRRPSLEAVLFGPSCFPLKEPLAPLNTKDFTFDIPLPIVERGREPRLRVLPQLPTPAVAAEYKRQFHGGAEPHFTVTVRMTAPVGGVLPTGFAATFLAGWRDAPPPPLVHVRVAVDSVVVQDALKPAVAGLDAADLPAGWRMQVNVNGQWQEIGGLDQISTDSTPGTFQVNAVFDQYLPHDATLRIHADASSKACFDNLFAHSLLEDLLHFGFTGDPGSSTLGDALAKGQLCLTSTNALDKELDAGEVDAEFTGPTFGARPAPYEVASQGENGAAYKLLFHIERVDNDGEETAVSER